MDDSWWKIHQYQRSTINSNWMCKKNGGVCWVFSSKTKTLRRRHKITMTGQTSSQAQQRQSTEQRNQHAGPLVCNIWWLLQKESAKKTSEIVEIRPIIVGWTTIHQVQKYMLRQRCRIQSANTNNSRMINYNIRMRVNYTITCSTNGPWCSCASTWAKVCWFCGGVQLASIMRCGWLWWMGYGFGKWLWLLVAATKTVLVL